MARKKAADTPDLFAEPAADVPPPADFPPGWDALRSEFAKPYWSKLQAFVAEERKAHTVLPAAENVFAALRHTPLDHVKLVLLGQDPYPTPGHAHGLCFSVLPGVPLPGSLRNIYQEIRDDLGIPTPTHGYLMPWADRGVLLLNAVLTVRAGEANSHKAKGWETFTDAVLKAVNDRPTPAVFLLWGAYAQKKAALIDSSRHRVIGGTHPSPLSARSGFFGSKPFSTVNAALAELGQQPIDWNLPATPPAVGT